ncbi:MAG: TldD/PmbA family protein [Chloroherpetonaceae bacterium]|nr:TldD/PmbA family protein [Chloroherpetonaceae bacterium]
MKRRDFIKLSALGLGSAALVSPVLSKPFEKSVDESRLKEATLSAVDKKNLATVALTVATSSGASYADVRLGMYLRQAINTREKQVQGIQSGESLGAGVRVIVNGTWGFSSTNDLTADGIAKATRGAVAIAKANSRIQTEPVKLAPTKGLGEVSWKTPILKNGFDVPIKEKVEVLLSANAAAMTAGASFVNSQLFLINEQKYFASTDGSFIDQDIHRIWPNFSVTVTDGPGKFETRLALSAPSGMGYEYLDNNAKPALTTALDLYDKRYNMIADARDAAKQAKEKLRAKSVEKGKYDLVLDPTHLFLTIHESVGHPLELDRVLGYEANYAGTSFATLDKWKTKKFNYGSPIVNFFADKTQPGSLGSVGYDDEGVQSKRWDLVKDGVLVNYQATRDQVHIIDQNESHGCSYADSWSSVQFQRMPNVSLAPGKKKITPMQMIKDVKKGIYIVGRGSYSIDQQRYNFQFGGQLFYEIKDGKIAGMLKDVAYQSNTQEFWNSCSALCDERDYRLNGSFFDGKGQPSQVSAVSHGSPTARFNGINVLNTGRKI